MSVFLSSLKKSGHLEQIHIYTFKNSLLCNSIFALNEDDFWDSITRVSPRLISPGFI